MSATNNGGPAFPVIPPADESGAPSYGHGFPFPHDGMTLRDYFAAKAMQAAFAGDGARMIADRDGRYDGTNWDQVVALNAYEMADAMLAEREVQR